MVGAYESATTSLPSSPDCLERVSIMIEDIWAAVLDVSIDDRLAFGTAVLEVAANIVLHSGGLCLRHLVAHAEGSGRPGRGCARRLGRGGERRPDASTVP